MEDKETISPNDLVLRISEKANNFDISKYEDFIGELCGEREYQIEVDKENPESRLETTGAGDAFAAGFLFGLLNGKSIERCGLLGNIMASFAIIEVGARNGLPSLAQLSQRYLKRSGHKL
jgi:fructose-1-phosphate kinase PfkB-like protein